MEEERRKINRSRRRGRRRNKGGEGGSRGDKAKLRMAESER